MSTTEQPEALHMADTLEWFKKTNHQWTNGQPIHLAVAAELRRLHAENETLRAGYDAARLELASLQARANECGAGAGCCAQAARQYALEAQLESIGAGGVGRLVPNVSLTDEGDMVDGALTNEGTMPAAQAQPVAGQEDAKTALARIYEIATSTVQTRSRDMGDWYDDMERVANIAAQQGGAA